MGSVPNEATTSRQQGDFDGADEPFEERRQTFWIAEPMKLIPVFFVVGIISLLYVVFVFCHCVPMLQADLRGERRDEKLRRDGIVQLIVFHFFTVMLLICYARSILTHPGEIPNNSPQWEYIPQDALPSAAPPAVKLQETKSSGDRRHCKWCGKYKPDRCHHCRVCQTCVLKMDHHCPWIYNCVGFRNYKFFFLLLFYTVCDLQLIIWSMMPTVGGTIVDDEHFWAMFFLLFGETVACFLGFFITAFFAFHIWLTWNAMTTIEFCEKSLPKKGAEDDGNDSIYNLGPLENFRAALGRDLIFALLPTTPRLEEGNGLSYRVNLPLAQDTEESRRLGAEKPSRPRPRRFKRRSEGAGGFTGYQGPGAPDESLGGVYYGTMASQQGLVPRTDESLA